MKYEVGIVDDHQLFSKSLGMMLDSFPNFSVSIDVTSGEQLQQRLKVISHLPDIILLDVNMPVMSGIECAAWLTQHYPAIKVAALSMNDTDNAVISMVKAGCCGYLLKNTHPNELEKALLEIAAKGYYNADSSINFKRLIRSDADAVQLTDTERKFLQSACSDLTYRHIAGLMHVTERTIETYRVSLFAKLQVQSRTGMAMEALRRGLVEL